MFLSVFGHQRGGGQHGHAGLTDRHHRRAFAADRMKNGAEGADIVDIVVEAETPLGQRHVAGVVPVGDVNLMGGQHRLHRAAQQGGEMA